MGLRAVHQWVPSFVGRDAIGGHALRLRDELRSRGLESEVYVEETRGEVASIARHHRSAVPDRSGATAIVYHLSTGSTMADRLARRPEPLIVDYHNITPPSWFAPWDGVAAATATAGRRALRTLAPVAFAAMADSSFNESELVSAGYRRTGVVPVLADISAGTDPAAPPAPAAPAALAAPAGSAVTAGSPVPVAGVDPVPGVGASADPAVSTGPVGGGGGALWLFVGRLVPNKCQHDVVAAFAAYRRVFDARARLVLVGGVSSASYARAVRAQVEGLGLSGVVELVGSVSDVELVRWYGRASVFVCVSEHEGFCVPLVEAMAHGVPVVAFGAAAVGETVGGGGLVLGDKSPLVVAAAVDRVVGDRVVREGLVGAGRARVGELSLGRARVRLHEFLDPVLADLDQGPP